MSLEIWKFPLGNGGKQEIIMPKGAEVLTVQTQQTTGHACLWAMCDPDGERQVRTFHVVGTGQEMPKDFGRYVGTIQQEIFVWHIFEDDA
jgi:hypothetical protein